MSSRFLSILLLIAAQWLAGCANSMASDMDRPTVVLVHGAFADGSSWNDVIPRLQSSGLRVISAANPLRGLAADAEYIGRVVDGIQAPVILVGHSYGGAVISEAAAGRPNVRALVFVAAFVPDAGESAAALASRYPGGTLGEALDKPVVLSDGGQDLYIAQQKFHQQFAADVPPHAARVMAAAQRPIRESALTEPARVAAWKQLPSWSIYGTADRNIPAAAMEFMSKRAGAKRVVEIQGASHVVMVSHAEAVADLIIEASRAVR